MTKYAAIYARLSPRPDGSYEGVEDQEKWGRDYCASAWPDLPVVVFADRGISAANGDHRPEYEKLRAAIRAGDIARLWTVEQTRLQRTEVGWFELAAELDAAGITELHTNRDGIVRVRDEVAGIKAVLAAGEVRKIKRRVNDRLAEIAAEGRPTSHRPYGYVRGLADGKKTLLVVAEQAAVIRDAADKVLAGWSLARVAADLNERGMRGRSGGTFTGASVKSMLTNPSVAGQRVHQGRVVGKAAWVPILDQKTWHAVRNKLAAPRTVVQVDGNTYPISGQSRYAGRRYLLTGGVAVCGVCRFPLVAQMKQLKGGKRVVPYYLCHPKTGGRGCVGIMADAFEQYVVDRLFAELDKPAFLEALAADEQAEVRERIETDLRDLEDVQRPDLARMWATRELTAAEWQTARRALAEQEQVLRRDLAALPPPAVDFDAAAVRAAWPYMVLDEQRQIIGMFIEHVVVKRARPGTKGFDENRVGEDGIEWRTR